VRHGATEWNINKRAQGHADIDLTDEGKKQAIETAADLKDTDVVAVYSSGLKRARYTADAIAAPHRLEVQVDERFREIDQGEWEGLTVDEIQLRWPELWGPARHYSARPGGETPQEVRARALEGLRDVIERHPEGTVVIVSHGGTIRWLSAEALGYDDLRSARIRGLGNGGVVSITASLNDGRLHMGDVERWDGATPDLDDPNDYPPLR
jgi:broad specificity phosphatase PhoE